MFSLLELFFNQPAAMFHFLKHRNTFSDLFHAQPVPAWIQLFIYVYLYTRTVNLHFSNISNY